MVMISHVMMKFLMRKDVIRSSFAVSCEPADYNLDDILLNLSAPKIDDTAQNACECMISLNECSSALKNMSNNKTPGSYGLPTEFYQFFFKDISKNWLDCFNYSFNIGKL